MRSDFKNPEEKKPEEKNPKEKKSEEKKNKKQKNTAVWVSVTSLVLAVVMIFALLLSLSSCDSNIDYTEDDLSRFVYISPEKYKNFSINAQIREPSDIDTEFEIIKQLYRFRKRVGAGEYKTEGTLSTGDKVYIYYRGYILTAEGEKQAFDGGCNFSDSKPYELMLGSASFITGFEYNLIGKDIGENSKFEKITEGTVKENQVVYVSGVRTDEKAGVKNYYSTRLDLAEDLDASMGAGFESALIGKTIGENITSFKTTLDGKEYTYSLKVGFATECEENPITVETYFPYNYGEESLKGKTAYFDVYVQKYVDFETPELTDEFIKDEYEELGITLSELDAYEGNTLVEKYKAYISKTLRDRYESDREVLIESEVWAYLVKNTEIKKYPEKNVEIQHNIYYSELKSIYGYYSQYYQTLGDFVRAYYSLSASADWEAFIRVQAEAAVAEKMMFYYIVRNEGWTPSPDELERLRNEAIEKDLAEQLLIEDCKREDYGSDAAYEAAVAVIRKRLITDMGESHYIDVAYYEYGMEKILKGVEINP